MAGIVGYGAYIPRYRIKTEEIARQWGKDPAGIRRGLLLEEKSVPGLDEDTITISVAASRDALARAGIDPRRIGAVYVGSESHPYAVKPSGTVLIEALGVGPEVHVADYEFACKAGTEAMFVALGLVESRRVDYALAVGADTSQGAPGDALTSCWPTSSRRTESRATPRTSGGARASSTRATAVGSPASRRTSSTSPRPRAASWTRPDCGRRTFVTSCSTCPTASSLSRQAARSGSGASSSRPAGS
jgi:hypothetical protein